MCAIGFFVTCTMIDWPLRSTRSMLGLVAALDVVGLSNATSPR